jgi:hypothetical protein
MVTEQEADCISHRDVLIAIYSAHRASLPAPSPAMDALQETSRNNPAPRNCSIRGDIERVVEAKHLLSGCVTSTGMSVREY